MSQDTRQNKCLKRRQEGSILPIWGLLSLHCDQGLGSLFLDGLSLSLRTKTRGLPSASSTSEELAMGQARERISVFKGTSGS